jgi:hypothetical protein
MDVPVWDPSGEALIEVTDPTNGTVFTYWMQYQNREWLVAGTGAPPGDADPIRSREGPADRGIGAAAGRDG